MFRLQKTLKNYKDFEKLFNNMWANTFYNYTTIFVSLFGKKALDLHFFLDKFYTNIYEFSTVYKWQDIIFPIIIKTHTFIIV